MSALGDYVHEVMKDQDVSQLELQRRTDIPDTTLARILAGQEPKPSQIGRIAKALDLTFWKLMQIGGYTTEDPEDPDEEARRLIAVLLARPLIRELMREVETLATEEQESVLTYIATLRQRRPRRRSLSPSRRKKTRSPPEAQ